MTPARLKGMLVGLAGAFTVARAFAQEPTLPGLTWQAPEGCPQAAAVRERVRAIIGSPNSRESHLQAQGEITKEDTRFHLRLIVRDGNLVGERNITSDACEDLAGAAAVALGLLLRSEAPLTESQLSGDAASDGAAATAPAPAPSKPPPVEAPATKPAWNASRADAAAGRARVLLQAPKLLADFGPLPKPSWGFGLGAGVSYRRFRLLVTGALWLGQNVPLADRTGYGADVTRKSLALSVGRGFSLRSLELAPCVGLALEHLTARGFGPGVVPSQPSAVGISAGAGLLAAWHFDETLALVAEVGGRVQASRPIISIDGLGDVRQLAPLSLDTALAAEWAF